MGGVGRPTTLYHHTQMMVQWSADHPYLPIRFLSENEHDTGFFLYIFTGFRGRMLRQRTQMGVMRCLYSVMRRAMLTVCRAAVFFTAQTSRVGDQGK